MSKETINKSYSATLHTDCKMQLQSPTAMANNVIFFYSLQRYKDKIDKVRESNFSDLQKYKMVKSKAYNDISLVTIAQSFSHEKINISLGISPFLNLLIC